MHVPISGLGLITIWCIHLLNWLTCRGYPIASEMKNASLLFEKKIGQYTLDILELYRAHTLRTHCAIYRSTFAYVTGVQDKTIVHGHENNYWLLIIALPILD